MTDIVCYFSTFYDINKDNYYYYYYYYGNNMSNYPISENCPLKTIKSQDHSNVCCKSLRQKTICLRQCCMHIITYNDCAVILFQRRYTCYRRIRMQRSRVLQLPSDVITTDNGLT